MRVIKALVYIAASSVATIAYREGNGVLMNVMAVIMIMFFAYDGAMYMTNNEHSFLQDIVNDFFADGTKKENQSQD